MHLFRENDRSRELYLIQSGTVKVYRTAGGKEVELAVLEKGAVLGEMALIDGKPRSASVKALEETSVIIIDAETFHSKVKGIPPWFLSIIRNTSQKIRQANRRLQSISSNQQGARIIITLCLYFQRFGKDMNKLPVANVQHHMIQLLGVTFLDITNTIDFLCRNSFITLERDTLIISDAHQLCEYCEFLRFILRKQFDTMDSTDTKLGQIAEIITTVCAEILKSESGSSPIEGDHFYHLLQTNNLDENYLDLIEQLHTAGYITSIRKQKVANSRPLADLSLKLQHTPWKRAYLYYKYLHQTPGSL